MVNENSIKQLKENVIVNLWSCLNTYVDRNYRRTATWGRRSSIVDFYCTGKGIEIGASCYPVKINNKSTKISYVDCIDRNITIDLKTSKGLPYVHVDIIDEAETLAKIRNVSLNFIIHCHMLEHCINPINVIRTHLTKLKRQGVLVISIPSRDYFFDKERPLTKWEHFVLDDEMESEERNREHFREYLELAVKYEGDIEAEIDRLKKDDYRPHYHVWNLDSFYDFLMRTNDRLNNAFIIEHYSENIMHKGQANEAREIIAVLRKR